MKKLALLATLGYIALVGSAQANIQVTSFAKNGLASCDRFEGHWNGDGRMSGEIIFSKFKCHYKGTVDVYKQGSGGQYLVKTNLDLVRSDSDIICLAHGETTIPGNCSNGVINLTSDAIDLHGNLEENSADMSGTIKVNIAGSTITSKVDNVHLSR